MFPNISNNYLVLDMNKTNYDLAIFLFRNEMGQKCDKNGIPICLHA